MISQQQWAAIILFTSGIAIAWGIQQLIGYRWFHARPWVVNASVQPTIHPSQYSKSFPSDHAAISFATATVSFLWFPRYAVIFLALALVIALSRVLVGVHRFVDVITGAFVGTGVVLFIHRVMSL